MNTPTTFSADLKLHVKIRDKAAKGLQNQYSSKTVHFVEAFVDTYLELQLLVPFKKTVKASPRFIRKKTNKKRGLLHSHATLPAQTHPTASTRREEEHHTKTACCSNNLKHNNDKPTNPKPLQTKSTTDKFTPTHAQREEQHSKNTCCCSTNQKQQHRLRQNGHC